MPSFIEKLVAEIIVSLCVGAVLGLISGTSWTQQGGGRRPAVCDGCRSGARGEGEPDHVGSGDEHR